MKSHQPFHGLRYEGTRFDCGDKAGFLEAQIAFALARPDLAGAVRDHQGDEGSRGDVEVDVTAPSGDALQKATDAVVAALQGGNIIRGKADSRLIYDLTTSHAVVEGAGGVSSLMTPGSGDDQKKPAKTP